MLWVWLSSQTTLVYSPQGPYGGGPRGGAAGGGGGGGSDLERKLQAAVAANRSGLQMGAFDGGIMDALSQLSPPALQVTCTARRPWSSGLDGNHRQELMTRYHVTVMLLLRCTGTFADVQLSGSRFHSP